MSLGKSPYEALFNAVPEYNQLKVFGSLCYATVLPQPSDKFAARSIKGVFLGYPCAKKGYKVLNLQTRHVIVSRDVHFVENIFSFEAMVVQSPGSSFHHLLCL